MDIKSRLIAPSFRLLKDGQVGNFDLDAFLKRFLLFETYIIDSRGLTELPHLIRAFTLDGLFALIESGSLRINCSFRNTGSKNTSIPEEKETNKPVYQPFHYTFVTIEPAEINEHVNFLLQKIEPKIQLTSRQKVHLRKAIYKSLEHPIDDSISMESTRTELTLSPNVLKSAVSIAMFKHFGIQVRGKEVEFSVRFDSENDFSVESNIQNCYDLDQLTAHKVIESACLAIAKRNDRIEQMRRYSALTGFSDIDLPIFGERLEFLASSLSPDIQENRFQRIIELTGLPQIKNDQNIHLDAKQLMKIRDSVECVEFRQWLATTDAMSDDDVIRQVRSLANTIGRYIGGEPGQNIRFLITNGIGFVPVAGQIISLPLSILDHFLLEKIFPRSGVSAFIDDMYPSIFDT